MKSVEDQIVTVGNDLARTFSDVLDAIPGGPHRPQRLARSLGVNTILTSRLLKAAQQHDPMAVAHMVPGPEPLRRLLRAAERKKVNPELIREARAAVDRFAQLIDVEAGDRSALDAIISGWLPDARERVELIAKQSVFRGISQLLGTACDVQHHTAILYPSSQRKDRVDQLWISVAGGLRRVRPGLVVHYDTVHATGPMLTVAGKPVEGLDGLLLEQFCSKPLPELEVSHADGIAQYTLSGSEVGTQSAVQLVHATFLPGKQALYRSAGDSPRRTKMTIGIALPSRTLIFDVLVHQSVYTGQDPNLSLYRTVGVFHRDPSQREIDRLDVIESIQPLGAGIAKFRAAETPANQDMIRYVCARREWDVDQLRGYRCRIEYPIYGAEIVIGFDLGVRPD
ncbi:MAG TPA: hypothetical protein VNT79_05850 [Phycisphaerae bacterium]|nr:hypothetical protein [Phycisphaerae bacterium]